MSLLKRGQTATPDKDIDSKLLLSSSNFVTMTKNASIAEWQAIRLDSKISLFSVSLIAKNPNSEQEA